MFRRFGSIASAHRRDFTLIDAAPSGERLECANRVGGPLLSGAPIARLVPRYDATTVHVAPETDAPPLAGVPLLLRIQIVDAALAAVGRRSGERRSARARGRRTTPAAATRAGAITTEAGIAEIDTVFPAPKAGRSQVVFQAMLGDASVRGMISLPDEVSEFLAEHVAPYCGSTDADATFALGQAYLAQAVISVDRSAPRLPGRPPMRAARRRNGPTMTSRAFATVLAVSSVAAHLFGASGATGRETATSVSADRDPQSENDR